MALYAQHGYGKSDKIDAGIQDGSLGGVVLSPRDEKPTNLAAYVASLRDAHGTSVEVLLDPQFYATTISPVRDGSLPDYAYYEPGLTRRHFIGRKNLDRYARQTLDYQAQLELDRLIAPAPFFTDFRDPWSQIALSMLEASIDHHSTLANPAPLLLSLAFDEAALRNRDALDEFLDIVTAWEDVGGFYILVRFSDPGYPAYVEESVLGALLYLTYVLGEVNGYEVVAGYSDLVGVMLRAVGATSSATGWYNSLRQFSLSRFMPSTGGRAPRQRYTSAPLLNSLLVVPEVETASQQGQLQHVLSRTPYDHVMTSNPADATWPRREECLHHWNVLASLTGSVTGGSVPQNLDKMEKLINQARANYTLLEAAGVPFAPATGSRNLTAWTRAIGSFRADAGL